MTQLSFPRCQDCWKCADMEFDATLGRRHVPDTTAARFARLTIQLESSLGWTLLLPEPVSSWTDTSDPWISSVTTKPGHIVWTRLP